MNARSGGALHDTLDATGARMLECCVADFVGALGEARSFMEPAGGAAIGAGAGALGTGAMAAAIAVPAIAASAAASQSFKAVKAL